MQRKQIFRLPTISTIVWIGIVIIIFNQFVLYILNSNWQTSIWMLFYTSTLVGFVCYGYQQIYHNWKRRGLTSEMESGDMSQELQGALEQSEKLKLAGILAAGIAHEIRNPLTSLRGFLQLFQDHRYSEIMLSEVDRINEIVNELLELAKPKASFFEPRKLQPLLRSVITFLTPQAILCNVQLLADYAKSTEHLTVLCDENKLKQLFINIIKNAIESMSEGGHIYISLTTSRKWAKIEILDTGCGIPEEKLERLGQPFFTTKERGTGLGLMVSQRIVQDHHGTMNLHSKTNKGTAVTVKLPIITE